MKKFSIKFKHTIEAAYTAVVESETKASAIEAFNPNDFISLYGGFFDDASRYTIEVLEAVEIKNL